MWFPWGTIAVDHLSALHLPEAHYPPVPSAVIVYIISFDVFYRRLPHRVAIIFAPR